MAGREALSADFEESAIVHAPEVFGVVVSCSHCLKVFEAEGLGEKGIGG
jgi:hypothetical protein